MKQSRQRQTQNYAAKVEKLQKKTRAGLTDKAIEVILRQHAMGEISAATACELAEYHLKSQEEL